MAALTSNAVTSILNKETGFQPVLQVMEVKGIQANKQGQPQGVAQRYKYAGVRNMVSSLILVVNAD